MPVHVVAHVCLSNTNLVIRCVIRLYVEIYVSYVQVDKHGITIL